MSQTIAFNFRHVQPGQVAENNLISALFDNRPFETLLSETTQNTIDAFFQSLHRERLGHRARLKFTFTAIPACKIERYGLSTVQAHVDACTEVTMRGHTTGDMIPVLLMEDFSGGLDGHLDPLVHDVDTPLGRYLFAKGTGVEGKKGHSNGRHGLGANTGAAVSRLKMMLVHSTRFEGPNVASGRVSLPTHVLGGRRYASEVRLGIMDGSEWAGILEGDLADELHDAMSFRRDIDQPGLSCAIIDPVDDLGALSLAAAAMAQHFYQIVKGDIEYEIEDRQTGQQFFLSKETLMDIVVGESFAAIRQSVLTRGVKNRLVRVLDELSRLIRVTEDNLAHDDFPTTNEAAEPSKETRVDWMSGKPVACSFPISATHVDRGGTDGLIKVYAQKAGEDEASFDILVRDSIVNVFFRGSEGRLCIVRSEADDMAVLLGDAEDAAHKKYNKTNAANRGWDSEEAQDVISQFLAAGGTLQRMMVSSTERDDLLSLAHLFPMPGETLDGAGKGGAETDDPDAPEGEVIVADAESRNLVTYVIDAESCSITIRPTSAMIDRWHQGETFDLRFVVDYALKTKKSGSFSDTSGKFQSTGCASFSRDGNVVIVEQVADDFRLDILEVDPNRRIEISFARVVGDELGEAA
jgi:hypothetical protein